MLKEFLPEKHEYVLSIKLSDLQVKLYQKFLQRVSGTAQSTSASLGPRCRLALCSRTGQEQYKLHMADSDRLELKIPPGKILELI